MGFEGLNSESAEKLPSKEIGAHLPRILEKIKVLIDEISKTKKAIPVLGILAILGSSLEANAEEGNIEQFEDLTSTFETLIEAHPEGNEIREAVEDFERSEIDIHHEDTDEILYSQSLMFAQGVNSEPILNVSDTGEVPNSGENISVRGGTISTIYSGLDNNNSSLWEGLKYRVDIASVQNGVDVFGDVFDGEGSGVTSEEAVLNALSNGLGRIEIDSQEVASTNLNNENIEESLYLSTNSNFNAIIDEYEVVSVNEVIDEDGVSSYTAILRIQPGKLSEEQ